MRILALNWRDLAHPSAGGAEVYLEAVLRRWSTEHEVTLFTAAVEGSPSDEVVDGYRVVRRGGRFGVYREARHFWQQEGRGAYDVVIDCVNTVPFHANEWVDDGTPTIVLVHQTCEDIWNHNAPWPASWLGRWVLEPRWLKRLRATPVLAVSDSTAQAVGRFGITDVTVVPEGYEATPEALSWAGATKEERPTVVWCARLVDYKRPADMVRAVEIARAQVPDLQAWMIGGGPLLDELRSSAPEGVHFLGRVDESTKHEKMARAHAHVATSVREGWGLVVSEAAALGTPTLSYDVPGLRDSTRAADGVLCPPTPQALAAYLVDLLPQWTVAPPAPMPHGGAHSWVTVAEQVLAGVITKAKVPGTSTRPLPRKLALERASVALASDGPATAPQAPATTGAGHGA